MVTDDQQPIAQAIGLACYGEEPRCERLNKYGAAVYRMAFRDARRVLKLAQGTRDPAIGKEATLLAELADADAPVPALEHSDPRGERFGRPFLITTDVGVETVDSRCDADPAAVAVWAERMGETLAAIHRIDLDARPRLTGVLEHADIDVFWPRVCRGARALAEAGVFDADDVASFVGHPPPDASGEALCHADFSAQQCVADGEQIGAVVDWAAAWIGDPAIDVAIAAAHWDLARRSGATDAMLAGYRRAAPLPDHYEAVAPAAQMAFLVHVLDLWRGQGALAWQAAQRGDKLRLARELFATHARRLG